jgi:hypothetical protein
MSTSPHPNGNSSPNEPRVLWRYMDLYKFVWLLENSALYFARADTLGDEFEGSFPETSKEQRLKEWAAFVAKAEEEAKRKNLRPTNTPWEVISEVRRWVRQWVWVSCWHSSDAESDAMWRVYGGYTAQSVAVRTDLASLQACVPAGTEVVPVKYIDFRTECIPELELHAPFKHKRIEFKADQEVRAMIYNIPERSPGLVVPEGTNTEYGKIVLVDLTKLLKAVHVAPKAQAGFPEMISKLVKRYSLNIPVERSSLGTTPIF